MILVTHNDLDGVGCAIVASHFLGVSKENIIYSNHGNINEKIKYALSITDEITLADILPDNYYLAKLTDSCVIFDHHVSRKKDLDNVKCKVVYTEDKCATRSMYEYLRKLYPQKDSQYLDFLTNIINLSDLYKFENTKYEKECRNHKAIFALVGKLGYFRLFSNDRPINNKAFDLKAKMEYSSVLTVPESIKADTVQHLDFVHNKTIVKFANVKKDSGGNKFCASLSTSNSTSDLAKMLLRELDLTYCIIVNPNNNTASLYSFTMDMAKIAEQYGGGDHAQASGFKLTFSVSDTIYRKIITDMKGAKKNV